MMLSDKGV